MRIESPIYLAASYSRRIEMLEYAGELEALGYKIGAEWVTKGHEYPDDPYLAKRAVESWWAMADFRDIFHARTVINFTEPEDGPPSRRRGGRHVELGLALGMSEQPRQSLKTIILIGPCENIFHTLPVIKHFDTWEGFLAEVAAIDLPK